MTEALIDPVVFNPYDYHFHDDPYPTYKRLREESPLYQQSGRGLLGIVAICGRGRRIQGQQASVERKRSITRPRCIRSTRALCDVVSRYG